MGQMACSPIRGRLMYLKIVKGPRMSVKILNIELQVLTILSGENRNRKLFDNNGKLITEHN